jgi:hypothetical protein
VRGSDDPAKFLEKGFLTRKYFPHEVVCIPKQYPSTYAWLLRGGISPQIVRDGTFFQLNIYSSKIQGLPAELFTDPEINWHAQQFGRAGLVAAVSLFAYGRELIAEFSQSDLVQLLHRHSGLHAISKARVDDRFHYWYRIAMNAALDFAALHGFERVFYTTTAHAMAMTRKTPKPNPKLFYRIYDGVAARYDCERVAVANGEYWLIPVRRNLDRIVPLDTAPPAPLPARRRTVVCISHDIEENVDTPVTVEECRAALDRMLAIEKSRGIRATYNLLGSLFHDKAQAIRAFDNHSIAFHSYNHDLEDRKQLPKTRTIDLRVKGYRPPRGIITSELTDDALLLFDYEWLMSGAARFGFSDVRLTRGLVKIPVHIDDYLLQAKGFTFEQWLGRFQTFLADNSVVTLGLHDCYARHWIDRYPAFLDHLGSIADFWTADDILRYEFFKGAMELEKQGHPCPESMTRGGSLLDGARS